MKVTQEFYCATSGGGCGGYVRVRLNIALNGVVEVVCPKCDHKHRRLLRDGLLYDSYGGQNRHDKEPTQELCPTLAAWSQNPRSLLSKKRVGGPKERHSVIIDDNPIARAFLEDRKHELWD